MVSGLEHAVPAGIAGARVGGRASTHDAQSARFPAYFEIVS
jgi:hypothetical protein